MNVDLSCPHFGTHHWSLHLLSLLALKNSHDKSFIIATVSQFDQKQERRKRLRGVENERETEREREAFKRILSVIDWLHSSANSHLKIMGLLVEIKASIVCLIAFWQMGADTTTRSIPPGTLAEHRPSISRSPIELALITGHELLIHVPYWRQRGKRKNKGGLWVGCSECDWRTGASRRKEGPFKRVPGRPFLGTGRTFR